MLISKHDGHILSPLLYVCVLTFNIPLPCLQETGAREGISAMPTFIFYKNKTKIDTMRGADPNALEEKIKQWKGGDSEGQEDDVTVKGHLDIGSFISSKGCECLNESDEHTLEHALSTKGGYLESDCDEQLIINLEFSQNMKLHSLKLYAPEDKGPKTVKIFQNLTKSLDFDTAENMIATQELELTPADVKEGTLIPLRYVKFQNVGSVTIFIKDNLGGGDVTQIDYLGLVGTPVAKTNMTDFKRVAGKKGESH
ncbi:Hypothetical predicted protein [Mytilus galloprovincialis]|uniref:PITH domain-containing protein n=1 Tax=Mytilus galloprovincialis TaxID=29158 RepID=A0A8B6FWH6_MYTGA|nr:Hypothetical predicted protein [Mytilus galloprovincialis]